MKANPETKNQSKLPRISKQWPFIYILSKSNEVTIGRYRFIDICTVPSNHMTKDMKLLHYF